MSKRKPYVRPMAGWWKKNPFYIVYMMQEWVSVFIAIYAVIVLVGLVSLSCGEASWNSWLAAMKSPLSLIVHAGLLAAMIYHVVAWFKVMPLSMPPIMLGATKLTPCAITLGGWLAAIGSNVVLLALLWGIAQ